MLRYGEDRQRSDSVFEPCADPALILRKRTRRWEIVSSELTYGVFMFYGRFYECSMISTVVKLVKVIAIIVLYAHRVFTRLDEWYRDVHGWTTNEGKMRFFLRKSVSYTNIVSPIKTCLHNFTFTRIFDYEKRIPNWIDILNFQNKFIGQLRPELFHEFYVLSYKLLLNVW